MSESIVTGGNTVETTNPADLIAVETPTTHVGTALVPFSVSYNNATLAFPLGEPFIADAGLYAAIGAGSTLVTWSN
jgi:hypothetical protein